MFEIKQEKTSQEKPWWLPAVEMFVNFSALTVLPVIIGAFAGRWLDAKFNTAPWIFLALVGLSFIIAMIGLISSVSKQFKKIDKKDDNPPAGEEK